MTLDPFLHPRSIAIVGASGRVNNRFARPLKFLLRYGYTGAVYPVNPGYAELHGIPCYPDLAALPEVPDLACVLVSADRVGAAVRQCAEAGVRAVIVYAAGFAELGESGARLQRELVSLVRDSGMRLLGPNSLGLMYAPNRIVATFSGALEQRGPEPGPIAYVGQSGAIGGSLLQLARESGLGVGAWFSTGNEADLTSVQVAADLIERPEVRVLALYVEGLEDGAGYTSLLARAAELGRHVVVLCAGTTAAGRTASQSHTAAMSPPNLAFELASREGGAVRVDDLGELVAVAGLLARGRRITGPRVSIITSSGGAGILATDACVRAGLVVEPFDAESRRAVAAMIPGYGSAANPVDVTAGLFSVEGGSSDSRPFEDVCAVVARADATDVTLVVLTNIVGATAERAAKELVAAQEATGAPLVVCWLVARDSIREAREILHAGGVPVLDSIALSARVIARALGAGHRRPAVTGSAPADAGPVRAALAGRPSTEAEAVALLDAAGIPRPRGVLVGSEEELARAVTELAGPLVLKIQSPDIPHKSDVGGVRLGVSAQDAAPAYRDLLTSVRRARPDAVSRGVLVQEMAGDGIELIVGVTRTAHGFPPVLTVGFGGVTTELYRDTASTLFPVDAATVRGLVGRLRAAPLLFDYRGKEPADVDAFVDVVLKVCYLMDAADGDLREIEVNPVIVYEMGAGATALDLLMTFDD
ncbi:acetate--CoA ligase family protein [Actinophytocola sp.]|uniref:acetate--CoA ligase family protein n=1 Tax=Actinophytocola sp. TaxID=1872138 RepID=UPI003D6AB4E7